MRFPSPPWCFFKIIGTISNSDKEFYFLIIATLLTSVQCALFRLRKADKTSNQCGICSHRCSAASKWGFLLRLAIFLNSDKEFFFNIATLLTTVQCALFRLRKADKTSNQCGICSHRCSAASNWGFLLRLAIFSNSDKEIFLILLPFWPLCSAPYLD